MTYRSPTAKGTYEDPFIDLLQVTDATMATLLATTYGRLTDLVADVQRGHDDAKARLTGAAHNLDRYLYGIDGGMLGDPDEDRMVVDLIEFTDSVGECDWEGYIISARDA